MLPGKPLIDGIMQIFKNLPELPHTILKLIDVCDLKKQERFKEIFQIVEKDLLISSKILRLLNSPYYGFSHTVKNINEAFLLVGENAVKNIAVCLSVYEVFNKIKTSSAFSLKIFWRHALRCAVMSGLIAKKINYSEPDEAFLSGFLHDIGKLVLCEKFSDQYAELSEIYTEPNDLITMSEIRFGITHSEVGAWLLDNWNFQSFIVDSVLYHHESESRILNAFPLVKIVYLANILSQRPIQKHEDGFKMAEKIFGFSDLDVEEISIQTENNLKEVAQALQMDIKEPEGSKKFDNIFSENDREKQKNFISAARDAFFMLETIQNLMGPTDQNEILKTIRKEVQLIFDVKDVFFFLYYPTKEALIGMTISRDNRFSESNDLVIPFQSKESLLIKSLHQKKPIHSFGRQTNFKPVILDEQIVRFTGQEGILCLPMVAYDQYVGVLVMGLTKTKSYSLIKRFNLLTLFAGQAALILHTNNLRQNSLKAIQSERFKLSPVTAEKILHEVNNPLSIIKNYLKILGIKLAEQDIARNEIRIISEEIDRISKILSNLTSFSEADVYKNEPVNMNNLLTDLIKIIKDSILKNSNIKIHLDIDPSVPVIKSKPNGLKQVFINLIKNAVEAMEGGGNLDIQTKYLASLNPDLHIDRFDHRGVEQRGCIKITISDDGIGISDEIKKDLFEPFIGSKGKDHAGLGLSIVYNIIKSLNGSILCKNNKIKGTMFIIKLPLVNKRKKTLSTA